MKKYLLFFSFTLITLSNIYSWDTTAAKLYPLQIGNVYVYERQQLWGQSCIPAIIEGRFMSTISSDTILNGKKYFVFSGSLGYPHWKYQRLDSTSMNVYYFSPSDSKEYLLDSLLGQEGDTLDGNRLIFGARTIISDIDYYNFLGQSRKTVSLYSWFSFAQETYQLVEGIGFKGMYACKFGGIS